MSFKSFILFSSTFLLFLAFIPAFATSPVFDRQLIKDEVGEVQNFKGISVSESKFFVPDIEYVTYSSDGSFINFTIWLNQEFSLKNISKNGPTLLYLGAAFDTDSDWETGIDGIDYMYSIGYHMPSARNTWSLSLIEFADSKNTISKI